jgi:hypothetical protein
LIKSIIDYFDRNLSSRNRIIMKKPRMPWATAQTRGAQSPKELMRRHQVNISSHIIIPR